MDTPGSQPSDWTIAQRIGFRFLCSYLVLYNFPFPIGAIPKTSFLSDAYDGLWYAFVPWLGRHVLHLSKEVAAVPGGYGSGDTALDYLRQLSVVVLAPIATLVWTLVDARRSNYRFLLHWLRVYVRYVLAFTLLSYGTIKIIQTQFPFPGLDRLLEPYGDSSPMGLLWTFMGYSKPYNFFAGICEASGGLLLFFRRTTILGTLLAAAVMLNIVVLNFCYDVPVKLYSLNLLLMIVFLMAPGLRGLANLLVLNRPATPASTGPPPGARWMRIASLGLKILFIGYALFSVATSTLESEKQYGAKMPRPPLYGIYEVEEFIRNGQALPPLTTDSTRWRKVVFQFPSMVSVHFMSDALTYYRAEYNQAQNTVTLAIDDKSRKSILAYSRPDAGHLVLQGLLMNEPLIVKLHRIDQSNFLLVNRGFHWINEFPFKR